MDMAGPGGKQQQKKKKRTDASETSPLLGNRPDVQAEFLNDDDDGRIGSNGIGNGIRKKHSGKGSTSLNGAIVERRSGGTGDEDEEALNGGSGEGVNAGFEGLPEVAAKMHLLLPALGIGVFLSAADQLIIVSIYGKIGSDLNALNSTSWIATAYFLTLTTIQPLYGALTDIFGRKPVLLTTYLIFGIGTLLCGLAPSMPFLIAARAFAGIGGGGLTTIVTILLSDIVPLRERGTWQGYANVVYAGGSALGAPLGGWLADEVGWRWAFIGQAPICAVAFVAVYFILDLPKKEETNWREKLARIDFFGAFLLILATTSLLLGLDRGSNIAWNDKYTLIALLLTPPLYLLFHYYEAHNITHPFAPPNLILNPPLLAPNLTALLSTASYLSTLFTTPLYYQATLPTTTATTAGLSTLPFVAASTFGSLLAGWVMRRTGTYRLLTIAAYVLLTLGHVPLLLCSSSNPPATAPTKARIAGLEVALAIIGLGTGIGVTSTLLALLAVSSPDTQAVATACSYLFRSLGSVIGISVASTIVQVLLRRGLQRELGEGEEAERIVRGVRSSLDFLEGLEPVVGEKVRGVFKEAVRGAWGWGAGVGGASIISAVFIRGRRLGR